MARSLVWLTPVFATIFAVASGEILCRMVLVGDGAPDHLEAGLGLTARLRPNYDGSIWGVPVHTNAWGFRSEADACPSDEAFCVLSLGDSIGVGVGIEAREHYSQVAERELAQAHPDVEIEILNAGGQGYSPSSYLVYYRNEGRKVQPDLVLLEIELTNDISDEALLEWAPDPDEPTLPSAIRGGRYVVAWDGNLLGAYTKGPYWYERTYLWSVGSRAALDYWEESHPNPMFKRPDVAYYRVGFDRALLTEERLEAGKKRLFSALKGLKYVLDQDGVGLFVLVLPARVVYQDAAPDQQGFARDLADSAVSELRAAGISHLDLRRAVSEKAQDLYLDTIHLNAEGNSAVGRAISEALGRRFLAEGPGE